MENAAYGTLPGDRVELHPATDAWMRGDRYGTVESVGPHWSYLWVRLDKSGKRRKVMARDVHKRWAPGPGTPRRRSAGSARVRVKAHTRRAPR